jgi:hypothetical protein
MIVTMRDVRAAKMCSRGARDFLKRHGFDWADFLENGVTPEQLEATGDPMAIKVAEVSRGRQQ